MEKIYFALVDTPGFFANIIRTVIKQDYVHVALSMDVTLQSAYSIGRRNPFVPYFAGFTQEHSEQIVRKFPDARYRILSITCTKEQKESIQNCLNDCYKMRFCYHYCIIGLIFLLMNIPFYQKNHYTCSSFAAKILEDNGLDLFQKHFSLVTPKDFFELADPKLEYEGLLSDYIQHLQYYKVGDECYET